MTDKTIPVEKKPQFFIRLPRRTNVCQELKRSDDKVVNPSAYNEPLLRTIHEDSPARDQYHS